MLGKLSHSGGREWCVALVSQEERRETKGNTDYFPVAHFSLLINQTSNIPRSSSIKNVKKNLREVLSVQPKHHRRISVKHNWNSRCPDPVCVCVSERVSDCLHVCLCAKVIQQLLQLRAAEEKEMESTAACVQPQVSPVLRKYSWNVCWQIQYVVYIHVYCSRNISTHYFKMRRFPFANPPWLSCNLLKTVLLQPIGFYTSWLAGTIGDHRQLLIWGNSPSYICAKLKSESRW